MLPGIENLSIISRAIFFSFFLKSSQVAGIKFLKFLSSEIYLTWDWDRKSEPDQFMNSVLS